jgi:hypothetical protein
MATINVANAAQLSAALSSASAGDTILLAAGNYGDVTISNVSFSSAVNIQSADPTNPAVFRSITINGSHELAFDNIEVHFTPNSTTVAWDSAIRIQSCSGISVTHSEILGGLAVNGIDPSATTLDSTQNVLGYPTARGVFVMNSTDVQITSNDISTFYKGVIMSNVSDVTITNNQIHDLRGTPISGGDVSQAVITGNYLHDITPWNFSAAGDHGDFIHLWTQPTTQTSASTGLVINDNFIDQGNGTAVLGIYLDDNNNGLGFTNVQINDNVIYNGEHQGIRLENVTYSKADGNIMLQSSGAIQYGPGFNISGDSTGLAITNNVISGLDLTHLTGDSRGNVLVQSIDSSLANFSGNLEGDTLTWAEAMQIRQHFTGESYTLGSSLPWDAAGLLTSTGDVVGGVGDGALGGTSGGTTDQTTSDPVTAPSTGTSSPTVEIDGTNGADQLNATGNGTVWVHGLGGNDIITGNAGDHWLFGDTGNDTFIVSDTATHVIENLGEGTDTVQASIDYTLPANVENLLLQTGAHIGTGNDLDNVITGNNDGNTLSGMGGNDTLNAGKGNDHLYGGDGNDTLIGGAGNDVMYGGAGNDTFVYSNADLGSRRVSYVDTIMDFATGDKIDLSAIDASTRGRGNNAFTFIGDSDFTGVAGQLHYYTDASHTYICGDRNGDRVADFTICLDGLHTLHSSDFVL